MKTIKRIHFKTIKKLLPELIARMATKQEASDLTGTYLIQGYRIDISKYGQSVTDRVKELYYKRKSKGLCVICSKKVKEINPRTGKKYRLCSTHRNEIDRK